MTLKYSAMLHRDEVILTEFTKVSKAAPHLHIALLEIIVFMYIRSH